MASKIISLSFSEAQYEALRHAAERDGQSVQQYIKSRVVDDPALKANMAALLSAVDAYEGREFHIRQFFDDAAWRGTPVGTRLAMGRAFYNLVQGGKVQRVCALAKRSNIQWYRKEAR